MSATEPTSERPQATDLAKTLRRVRVALVLVAIGLFVQLVTTLLWSPLMFVLFTVVGMSSVGLGALLFLWTVWRHIDRADDEALS